MFRYYVRWGFHNIFIVHGKHIDVERTMVCFVELKSCPIFKKLCMACVKSMALALHGKNQGFISEVCST
jgi:hypothetical protein